MVKPETDKPAPHNYIKGNAPLEKLIAHYEIHNRAEGKSVNTFQWYTANLRLFRTYLLEQGISDTLDQCNLNIIRGYVLYLLSRPRFLNHPLTPKQPDTLSPKSVQCHVRTLRAFASWLYREGYTKTNRLIDLKAPKAPRVLVEPLTSEEISKILVSIGNGTLTAARNRAMFLSLLDTGLRCSELINLKLEDVHLDAGYVKIMGKGSKERVVPFGRTLQKELLRYVYHIRPEPAYISVESLFLTLDGRPLTKNMIKLLYSRLAKKSGVHRLHIHLCRHTFAFNFITNGGDVFSLQQILGHTSLEMVRNYVNLASEYAMTKSRRFSPLDNLDVRATGIRNSGGGCSNHH